MKINGEVICTPVFSKPIDSHLLNSNHLRHAIHNIPKSQFLLLRKIFSNHFDIVAKSSSYAQCFISRGYDKTRIQQTIREATKSKRKDLLGCPKKPHILVPINVKDHQKKISSILDNRELMNFGISSATGA